MTDHPTPPPTTIPISHTAMLATLIGHHATIHTTSGPIVTGHVSGVVETRAGTPIALHVITVDGPVYVDLHAVTIIRPAEDR